MKRTVISSTIVLFSLPARGIYENILEYIINQYADTFKKELHHTWKDKVATVNTFDQGTYSINAEEQQYRQQRESSMRQAQEEFFNISLTRPLRISLVASGGSFRAAIGLLGFLEYYAQKKALSIFDYIVSLSGSTWGLAALSAYQGDVTETLRAITPGLEKALEKTFTNSSALDMLTDALRVRLLTGDLPEISDFYGHMITAHLLGTKPLWDTNSFIPLGQLTLAHLRDTTVKNNLPIPLFTAAIHHSNNTQRIRQYGFMFFTPFEVGSDFLGASIPAWAYGRKFYNGISVNNAYPYPLSLLMGIWGSALSITPSDLNEHKGLTLSPLLQYTLKQIASFYEKITAELRKFIPPSLLSRFDRLIPTHTKNFVYTMPNHHFGNRNDLSLFDAGIATNIPLHPLFLDGKEHEKSRKADIVIIIDISDTTKNAGQLQLALEYIQFAGHPIPQLSAQDYQNLEKNTASIVGDPTDMRYPAIIYIPKMKNKEYDPDFNPSYPSTKMVFSATETTKLAGLFNFLAEKSAPLVHKVVQERAKKLELLNFTEEKNREES